MYAYLGVSTMKKGASRAIHVVRVLKELYIPSPPHFVKWRGEVFVLPVPYHRICTAWLDNMAKRAKVFRILQ